MLQWSVADAGYFLPSISSWAARKKHQIWSCYSARFYTKYKACHYLSKFPYFLMVKLQDLQKKEKKLDFMFI